MALNYDGASLVPNLDGALRLMLGVAEKKHEEVKEQKRQDQVAGLESELDLNVPDPISNPANLRTVQRMAKLDPQAAQFGLQILKLRSEAELKDVQQQAAEASNFYQAVLDSQDPVERNRFITQTIREREEAGKDTTKLRELVSLTPDKQKLFARRQMILSGDAKLLADDGIDALIKRTELDNKLLERDQRLRDLAQGKYEHVASMRDDFVKQSQRFITVRDSFSSLQNALAQASASGDIAAIFSFMKSLDPTSSVREGEQATAKNAGGIDERVRSLYNESLGKGGLTPERRAEMLKTARGQYDTAAKGHEKLKSEFGRLAELRNFNPQEVLVDFSASAEPAAPTETPPSVPPAPQLEGRIVRDRTTGKRWLAKGGQWLPAP